MIFLAAVASVVLVLLFVYRDAFWEKLLVYYSLLTDREQVKAFIASFGMGAPVVFIAVQILQVIFAPIPGEATGFIGGFLFGAGQGFLYSSIALAFGSWINFSIGRFLGNRFVRKLIPGDILKRFDTVLKRQGIIVIFIFFVFPGFPKDYLCYFLGLSTFPLKIFIILASIGRMPGTFMLSLQGAFLYDRSYGLLGLIAGACLLTAILGYVYREKIYAWVERMNRDNLL